MSRRTARQLTISPLETLEDRLVLSAMPTAAQMEASVNLKGGPLLGEIYTEFVNYYQGGSQGSFTTPQSSVVEVVGPTVGVDIRFGSGNFATNAAQMKQLGMVMMTDLPSLGIVEGFMPIYQLPSVAVDPNLSSLTPVLKPTAYVAPTPTAAVPSGPVAPAAPTPTVAAVPTLASVEATIGLKGGTALESIYQEYLAYEQAGGTGTFSPAEASKIEFSGTSVGIDIRTPVADQQSMISQMKALGMNITATTIAGQVGVIEGFLPIAQLPAVAYNSGLVGMSPIYRPTAY